MNRNLIWILALLTLVSCEDEYTKPIPPVIPPMVAPLSGIPTLSIPANNEPCSIFAKTTSPKVIKIAFGWVAAPNAVEYEIRISRESRLLETQIVSGTQVLIELPSNAKYVWTVTAINADKVKGTPSQEFTFYAPAEPLVNTIPYAVINLRFDSVTKKASLSWQGIDPDANATLRYSVKVLENKVVMINIDNITRTSIDDFFIFNFLEYQVIITATDQRGSSGTSSETKTFRP
jgi:hypothetical protein